MSTTADEFSGLTVDEKRQLLKKLLQEKAASQPSMHPVSYMQRDQWVQNQLAPESGAYGLPIVARITSRVDVEALHQAFQALVDRHEVLRTTYESRDGECVQVVHRRSKAAFEHYDASDWPESNFTQRLHEELNRAFDLQNGPVHRVVVFSRAPDDHTMLFVVHHIACDFWSIEILIEELRALYRGIKTDSPPELKPLTCQFTDFVQWERELLGSPEADDLFDYWKEQLAAPVPILELPTDQPHPAIKSYRGGTRLLKLDDDLANRLRAFAQSENVTLYATLLTAFQTLLYRYSGQDDIIVGAPTAGRSQPEFRDVVGCLVGGIFVRGDLSGPPTFKELLRQTRRKLLGALEHQDYPNTLMIEKLKLPIDPSRSPIAQALFGWDRTIRLENHPDEDASEDWLRFETLLEDTFSLQHRGSLFDLMMIGVDAGSSLSMIIQHCTDIFNDKTILRLETHFQNLLESITRDPDRSIAELPMLSQEERSELLDKWCDGGSLGHEAACFHEMFQRAVDQFPDRTAVVFGEHEVTYRELEARANRIANWLIGQGVGPEMMVGLCVEPSVELIAGLWGILKAGGAFVPLDPAAPADRLAYLLDDAGIELTLTQGHLRNRFQDPARRTVVLDGEGAFADEAISRPPCEVRPDNAAYVIYTSGSTGLPKGVVIEHHNVVSLSYALRDTLYPADQCPMRVGLYAAAVFDASIEQIMQLFYGNTLYIPSQDVRLDAHELRKFVEQNALDVLDITPTQWKLLREAGLDPGSESTPRRIFLGGEPVDQNMWDELATIERLHAYNVYGPTESTVDATLCRISKDQSKPVIGRPIPGTQAYVLDEQQQPVAVGVVGELCLSGAGLARGYLNRSELTAEKFIRHPFSDDPNARLYRTGDLVRFRSDRSIEYVGRNDGQVKIRGFRIETQEIEAALARHPDVGSCAVAACNGVTEAKLVGYIVPRSGVELRPGSLRSFLTGKLPYYMVPSNFIQVDRLPMTTSGKVDLKALPSAEYVRPESAAEFVAPRNEIETELSAIWSDVLDIGDVGVHDSFFDLGGHSILATRIISRVRSDMGVDISIRAIFEAPTIAEFGMRVEIARRSNTNGDAVPLRPVERGAQAPLSFAQQRLWLIDRLMPGSTAYNIPFGVRIRGRLDVDVLRECFSEIYRRHETLRTTFTVTAGEPVQVIRTDLIPELPLVDLRKLSPEQQVERSRELLREEANRPFDLSVDPKLRTTVLQLSGDEFVILMTMHHIASDAWSMGVLIRETAALYEAFSQDQPTPLARLPIQYADYAVWQRQSLGDDILDGLVGYWTEALAGPLPQLELPTDRARPAVQTDNGSMLVRMLPRTLADDLERLSRREGVTLFMTLYSIYVSLLHRLTGQTDFAIGTPVAGRDRIETEGLIGFFVNTLVLRSDVSGDPTFRETLAQVKETCLGAYAHQQLPFEHLVDALNLKRDLSHSALFQTMFSLQNTPLPSVEMEDGLTFEPMDIPDRPAMFDLTLDMSQTDEGLIAAWEFNTDLFDRETIEQFADSFELLLRAIADDCTARLSELPVLSETARQQLLVDWNDGGELPGAAESLPQLFEEQAERTPDAPAVVFEGRQLTYHELNARSNQLARVLQARGVSSERFVGLCLEPSIDLVVGLLGIQKAGGAYLPIAPDAPTERVAFMLDDADVQSLVTQTSLQDEFAKFDHLQVVCADDAESVATECTDNLPDPPMPNQAAYVIYTSGSTGQPKGVVIEHGSLAALASSHRRTLYPALECPLRTALYAPTVFDASLDQIVQLAYGSTLYVPPETVRLDPQALASFISKHKLDVVDCTPTQLSLLLGCGLDLDSDDAPRIVVAGGEAIGADLWSQLAGIDRIRAYNVYGPTESTVDATLCRISKAQPRPVIGRPIPGTQAYILDEHRQPVPVGVVGELCLSGAGLARGYLNQPQLTAQKFVAHPFVDDPDARLYRTGDRARYLRDGSIEFMGRADDEVKIRGFRITLGEIEVALSEHPDIRDAVVLAREDDTGTKRLIGYVVPVAASVPPFSELRRFLSSRLPAYMLPAAFVTLETLPLTSNGKLDEQALPQPEIDRLEVETEFVAPSTPLEQQIAQVWCDVLDVERVGVHDNFFDLGGYSLLIVQVVSRIRETLGAELPFRTLFEAPTVAELASRVDTALLAAESSQPRLQRVTDRTGPFPLSVMQDSFWFFDRVSQGTAASSIAGAIRVRGPLDTTVLERCFRQVAQRHETLRTTFSVIDGQTVQVVSDESRIQLMRRDLTHLSGDEQDSQMRRQLVEEWRREFDLGSEHLLRVLTLQMGPDDHVVAVSLHHIISDGWSMNLLIGEVLVLYHAEVEGAPIALPELPVQYSDYVLWQRELLQGEIVDRQVSWWKEQLAGPLPDLDLPTDRPRPPLQSTDGVYETLLIPRELTRQLKTLCRQKGVTPFMLLLAAFNTLLHRYTHQTDIIIGSNVAGRGEMETEGLIGVFLNLLALRTDSSGNPKFTDFLSQIREVSLGAFAHQDAPHEMVADALQVKHTLSRADFIQAFLNYQDNPAQIDEVPNGWQVDIVEPQLPIGRRDLNVSIDNSPQGFVVMFGGAVALFDPPTIKRLAVHFHELLRGIVSDPEARLSELPLLSQAERQQLLIDWSHGEDLSPTDASFVQLFEEQVERTPDALAVAFDDQELTYRELNTRCNQLAHCMLGRGARPETMVGLCMEPSTAMIVGLLGILKTGAAYVVLEPHARPDQRELIFRDADTQVLVTDSSLSHSFDGIGLSLVCVDDADTLAAETTENPAVPTAPDQPACVIYTEDSAGTPHGLVIEHGQVVNLVRGQRETVHASAERSLRVAIHGTAASNASIMQLAQLAHGHTLCLTSECIRRDPTTLRACIEEMHLDMLDVAPSMLKQLRHAGLDLRGESAPSLIVLRGETIDQSTWQELSSIERIRAYNVYDATECAADAVICRIADDQSKPVIGRPVPGMQTYVLDEHDQPVPIGVVGELCLSGAGVARGYLNRPDVTTEKFARHPFEDDSQSRLYKTGDLARFRPDGTIEFLGRAQDQVTIRGLRIPLSEIEDAILQHPAVQDAAVVPGEDGQAAPRLVGYLVPAGDKVPDVSTMRRFLSDKIPDFMVPDLFVSQASLPLADSGKLDRTRLPQPDFEELNLEEVFVAPTTLLEERLAAIWSELLDVEAIGIHDDFFELGGETDLAARMLLSIETELGVDVPLHRFLQKATVAGLAGCVGSLRDKAMFPEKGSPLVAIQPQGSKPPFFCVHSASGTVLSFGQLARHLGQERPVYGLEARGLDGNEPPCADVNSMAADYLAAIRDVQPQGPYLLGGWSMGGLVAYEMARRLEADGESVALLALFDSQLAGDEPDVATFQNDLERQFGISLNASDFSVEEFRQLEVDKQIEYIAAQAGLGDLLKAHADTSGNGGGRKLGLIADSLRTNLAQGRVHLAVWNANDAAMQDYKPQPSPVSATLFLADEEPDDIQERVAAEWRQVAVGGVQTCSVPGNHYSMFDPQHVETLAGQLSFLFDRKSVLTSKSS